MFNQAELYEKNIDKTIESLDKLMRLIKKVRDEKDIDMTRRYSSMSKYRVIKLNKILLHNEIYKKNFQNL